MSPYRLSSKTSHSTKCHTYTHTHGKKKKLVVPRSDYNKSVQRNLLNEQMNFSKCLLLDNAVYQH